ncbi:RNA polymerase sigma factor [Ferruginibacter sp.]
MRTPSELTDDQLIELYIDGDNNAFTTIVTRHKSKIYTSIYLLIKDKYLAEDIFQDVFVRIIDTIKSGGYKGEGKFIPWAMCIARNMSMDHFRKIKRNPVIKTSDDKDIFDVLDFAQPGIEQKIIKEETYEKVRKLLDMLPENQREVVILRHYANLSFKEISTLTNDSKNTSLGRMRYGLLNLKKIIKKKELTEIF